MYIEQFFRDAAVNDMLASSLEIMNDGSSNLELLKFQIEMILNNLNGFERMQAEQALAYLEAAETRLRILLERRIQ